MENNIKMTKFSRTESPNSNHSQDVFSSAESLKSTTLSTHCSTRKSKKGVPTCSIKHVVVIASQNSPVNCLKCN